MPADYWLRAACKVVLAFLAGSEWHRVFGWGPVGVRVAVASVLPVAIAVVSRYRRPTRPGLGVLVSLVVLAWFLAVGALGDRVGLVVPSAGTPSSGIVHGLVDGWAAILSVPLPVPAQGEYLVLPVAFTWLAALVGAKASSYAPGGRWPGRPPRRWPMPCPSCSASASPAPAW